MSWVAIAALAAGAYGFKATGLHLASGRHRVVALLPAALFAGIIVVQTFNRVDDLATTLTRLFGVGVAALAVWRRAPLIVVIVAATVATAVARAVT